MIIIEHRRGTIFNDQYNTNYNLFNRPRCMTRVMSPSIIIRYYDYPIVSIIMYVNLSKSL